MRSARASVSKLPRIWTSVSSGSANWLTRSSVCDACGEPDDPGCCWSGSSSAEVVMPPVSTAERKSILLRLDPAVHDALVRWANDELRSTNAQIEYLLRRAFA